MKPHALRAYVCADVPPLFASYEAPAHPPLGGAHAAPGGLLRNLSPLRLRRGPPRGPCALQEECENQWPLART